MNTRRFLVFILVLFLLSGCASDQTPANPIQNAGSAPSVGQTQPAAQPETATPATAMQAEAAQRGPGTFDLGEPAAGLEGLTSYRATLRLVFEGTRQGQPYHLEKTYDQVVDHQQNVRLLTQESKDAEGKTGKAFSGSLGSVKYAQGAPDQPCQASELSAQQNPPFEPVLSLPGVLGAEEAGQETLGDVAAKVYKFDQRAIGADGKATASGTVWIAVDGGWVVKYELKMQSDQLFGEGISGEQRWEYILSEVGAVKAQLPDGCPAPLIGIPTPPDAANVVNLPSMMRFQTGVDTQALGSFYEDELKNVGFILQGAAVETPGGTRWVFSKMEKEQARMLIITAKPGQGDLLVTLSQVFTPLPKTTAQ